MMNSDHIIEVNESNFQIEVLAYSNQVPVVVDFWAEWCQPCHALAPILEKLAREANGAFRLAKVNADENPQLASQLNVRSLPTVKAFSKGLVTDEFVGAQPEPKVREFINAISPSENELAVEKGNSLLDLSRWEQAEASFRTVLKTNPDHSGALLGVAKSALAQGRPADALPILRAFPASKEYTAAETLTPLAAAMANIDSIAKEEDELAPMFAQALRLVERGNLGAAADGLLEVLRTNKTYRKGQARQAMLAVLEIMGENNMETRMYRQELASVLF